MSKITFHATLCQTGLQPGPLWKVQAFARTIHAAPHPNAFSGIPPWKVILFSETQVA